MKLKLSLWAAALLSCVAAFADVDLPTTFRVPSAVLDAGTQYQIEKRCGELVTLTCTVPREDLQLELDGETYVAKIDGVIDSGGSMVVPGSSESPYLVFGNIRQTRGYVECRAQYERAVDNQVVFSYTAYPDMFTKPANYNILTNWLMKAEIGKLKPRINSSGCKLHGKWIKDGEPENVLGTWTASLNLDMPSLKDLGYDLSFVYAEPLEFRNVGREPATLSFYYYNAANYCWTTNNFKTLNDIPSGNTTTVTIPPFLNNKVYLSFYSARSGNVTSYFRGSGSEIEVYGDLGAMVHTNVTQQLKGSTGGDGIFQGMTNLRKAPEFPEGLSVVNGNEFQRIYARTPISRTPEVPKTLTTTGSSSFYQAYWNCSNLVYATPLMSTNTVGYMYDGMFQNCAALTNMPALPKKMSLHGRQTYVFRNMFQNCISLRGVVEIPVMDLPEYTYSYSPYYASGMFNGCGGVTGAKVGITGYANPSSYLWGNEIFKGTSLTDIYITSVPSNSLDRSSYFDRLLNGFSGPPGTVWVPSDMETTEEGLQPFSGWEVKTYER